MPASTRRVAGDEASSERITVKSGGREWTIERTMPRANPTRQDKLITLAGVTTPSEPKVSTNPSDGSGSWVYHLASSFMSWLDRVFFSAPPAPFANPVRTKVRSTQTFGTRVLPRVGDAFQWGAIFGLLLGCLCVIGVRTIHPVSAVEPTPQPARVVSAPVVREPLPSGPPLMVPAVQTYGLYVAPKEPAQSKAKPAWHLVRIAAYSADLVPDKSLITGVKNPVFEIKPIAWNVHPLKTLPTTSRSASSRVSTWLSSEVSALCALIGSLSDGEPAKDAWTAYRTSLQLTPKAQYINATGESPLIHTFFTDVQKAFESIAHKNGSAAWASILQSMETLESMR